MKPVLISFRNKNWTCGTFSNNLNQRMWYDMHSTYFTYSKTIHDCAANDIHKPHHVNVYDTYTHRNYSRDLQ